MDTFSWFADAEEKARARLVRQREFRGAFGANALIGGQRGPFVRGLGLRAEHAQTAALPQQVAAFLHDKIGFYDISGIVSDCIASVEFIAEPTIEEIFSTNDEVFAKAKEKVGRW